MHLHLKPWHPGRMLSCILLAQLLGSVPAFCVSIIVPNDLFNVEGNAAATVPFDIGTGTARYQQVYDASQYRPRSWAAFNPCRWACWPRRLGHFYSFDSAVFLLALVGQPTNGRSQFRRRNYYIF